MNSTRPPKVAHRKAGIDLVVTSGVIAVLIFFLVSGSVSYQNITTLWDDNQRIIHSHQVIVAVGDLLSAAQDAETGQRGFLLTGDEKYLEPYNAAQTSLPAKIDEVAEMIRDNPTQQAKFALLKSQIRAKMAELQETIDLRRSKGATAALDIVATDRGKAAMDAIRRQLSAMDQEEDRLRAERIAEMADAYRSAVRSSILVGLLGVALTVAVGFLIRRAEIARRDQEWLQAGRVGLGSAIVGDQRPEQLGDNILSFLARYLGAHAGAVYVGGRHGYERVATYGAPADAAIPERFGLKDGLLGQAVREGRALLIADAPEGYLVFGSALGRSKPRHLIIFPAAVEGAINTVIELGFIRRVDESAITLLEQASESIATAVRSANYRAELQNLLEETQRQTEELQVQGEELRVSNEELEEQSRALRESQARLEQQQVDLEQTNSQLEEQTLQLEAQRDDLERANAAVQLKAREVEQASRYKSDFLANMSHELRTPLNSSLILAKLLADNPDDNLTDEQVKYAKTIESSGNDLLNLINDILDLSKIEAGHLEIKPDSVSLEQLGKGLRQLFQPVAQEKGLDFTIAVAPDCPPTIETDALRLEQVLKNLLSNAFKFTERGRVELAMRPHGEKQIALSVTDTGIGISEEQQQSVFEAFRQADGTISRKYGGTGLGLSISRELARLLGGSIQLRSREAQGSTFTVLFPTSTARRLWRRARSPREPAAARRPRAFSRPTASRKRGWWRTIASR